MKKSRFWLDMTPVRDIDCQNSYEHQWNLRLLRVGFFILFLLVLLRLAMVHLSPGNMLSEEEKLHIINTQTTERRGEIFDRNGVVLATNMMTPSIWVDPRRVEDSEVLADYLSRKLQMPREEVLEQLKKTDEKGNVRKFNMLKRWMTGLSQADLDEISLQSGGAASSVAEPVRYYPHQETAAHLLGFVNRSGEASEGVERAYDKHLAAKPGIFRAKADNSRRLLSSETLEYSEPKGGEMLQLTIDVSIQHSLEMALDERMNETQSVAAMGIIMDPKTGAVLAMATRPAFDPNDYDRAEAKMRKNRAIIDVFEPGSAFKIVTASAALENGLVRPETMIDCEGGMFNPYGHAIKDFHKMGVVPFHMCFTESSNIAMIKVAALLGEARLDEWIQKYGFGQRTSGDFGGESRGMFRPRKEWSRLSMGSLPMGQEISVTMSQLGRAYSVIANGGHLVEPYFVERAVARDGRVTYQHEKKAATRILSPKTARTMQDFCHQVVLHGTGTAANIMEYRAGGKTGTAQMARPKSEGGGYDPNRYTTVFAGFAPLSDPRLVTVIVIQEPKIKLRYGGYVCGPVFAKVTREALVLLGVPEDPVTDPEVVAAYEKQQKIALAAQKKEEPKREKKEINIKPSEPTDEADADTIAPPIDPATMDESPLAMIAPLDRLDLVARRAGEGSQGSMPDLYGLTKIQAYEKLRELRIPMDAQGAGWVVSQDPPPGTFLADVNVCALVFGRKGGVDATETPEKEEKKADADPDKKTTM